MKTRKLISIALACILALAIVPMAAFAENVDSVLREADAKGKLESVGEVIDAAEAAAIANGADRKAVISAVHEAVLALEVVDPDSFSDFSKDGFFFTVDGMYCAYNYRLPNELAADAANGKDEIVRIKAEPSKTNLSGHELKDAESPNVFLVGPYYGFDENFTDQYRNEAQDVAKTTGGEYVLLSGRAATGPAIAENFTNKGVVFFDSHGVQSGHSSYLCLTTDEGITSDDYNNGWAVYSFGEAYIDGRYIENHVDGKLANCLVWMAICEGMHVWGNGTTGAALLNAGAGVVYGYSQSVSFIGEYEYEETFWDAMQDGWSVADAFEMMVDKCGECDPYGDAYPIVMSPVDDFPKDPDSPQTVLCEWTLFGRNGEVPLESFSLATSDDEIFIGESASVEFVREPQNADMYDLVWSSDNELVATVKGNSQKCVVTGISQGVATISCNVFENGQPIGSAEIKITVAADQTLMDALNVEGGTLQFGDDPEYGFVAKEENGRSFAESNNQNVDRSSAELTTRIQMRAGDKLSFEYCYSTERDYDFYYFSVNGEVVDSGSGDMGETWKEYTYTAETDGIYVFSWKFEKDEYMSNGDDCVRIDNVAYSGETSESTPTPTPELTPEPTPELTPEPTVVPTETPEPTPTEVPVTPGDFDGDGEVSVNDALETARAAMELMQPSDLQLAAADVDGDGVLSMNDAIVIARIALGI